MRHIVPISGKDSLATALIQSARYPDMPYEFVFNDTECELPETYAWLDAVERIKGWKIERIGENLEAKIHSYNGFLPSIRARYCTSEGKIQPFERWLNGDSAIVYYGLRSDEQRIGYVPFGGSKITPAYPLRAAAEGGITPAGFDIRAVYSLVEAQGLTPPLFYWSRLADAVESQMSSIVGWRDCLQDWEQQRIFAGRSRGNCYFCFFQQMSELLWLLESHPDYYSRMADFEKTIEVKRAGRVRKQSKATQLALLEFEDLTNKTYHWIKSVSLAEFASNKTWQKQVFDRKVSQVVSMLHDRLAGQRLGIVHDSEISLTSCGLICGK